MPSILVETAFISNSSDANLLNTRQADFSVTIANSILSYFSKKTIDISYVLSQAKNIGLLKGTSLEFALLEAETPIKVVSVFPTITMSASVAITRKLNSLNSTVMNFAVDSNGLSAQFINKLGEKLQNGIEEIAREKNVKLTVNRVGGMMTVFFTDRNPVRSYDDAKSCDLEMFKKYFLHMNKNGFNIPQSQFESMFLSAVHTEEHIDKFLEIFKRFQP